MSVDEFAINPASIDEGLWRTNPVWCLERMLADWSQSDQEWVRQPEYLAALVTTLANEGIRLPLEALRRWVERGQLEPAAIAPHWGGDATPGVVGLVVDSFAMAAWVVPLQVERAREWSVDSTLPFQPPTVLQDVLVRLLVAADLPHGREVPERFAFAVRDMLGYASRGTSMLVAGALALVREVNGRPALLSRACAMVQPEGDQLVAVGSVRQKLEAFRREFGRGTLLVRHPGCPDSVAFVDAFDACWEVSSLAELARALERAELFGPFLEQLPLDRNGTEAVAARLHWLTDIEHRYREALDLSSRILACGYAAGVPAQRERDVERTIIDLYRHLGYYEKAEDLARRQVTRSRASAVSSFDEQAQADVLLAAALYDAHRFAQVEGLLAQWCERLISEPLLAAPITRVMVFNTTARARVIAGLSGWDELFRRSQDILREWEPTDLSRTGCYLAHGLVRDGRLDEARAVIDEVENQPDVNAFSRWTLHFLRAELTRQRREVYTSDEMEASARQPIPVGHPFGFYFQATARQPGRERDDAVDRFRVAFRLFSQDAPPDVPANVLRFLAACMRLGEAVWTDSARLRDEACESLARWIVPSPAAGFSEHYAGALADVMARPSKTSTDAFFRRVPFF